MNQTSSRAAKPVMVVCGALAAVAFGCWVYQQVMGLSITGMSNLVSWGTYICMFMFFVGLSAGGLIVASSASVFNIKPFKAIAKPAILLSTVCICAAGAFILLDLGGIVRIWRILTGPNPSSPLVWDMTVITIYLVMNLVYIYLYTRKNPDHRKQKIASFIALPVAILVHSVTAWIFGLQIGREWYSSIMAPLFVASALDSGLALLLIVMALLEKFDVFKVDGDLIADLAGLLCVFIAVDGYMVGCEILTMAYPGGSYGDYLAMLATGPTAPFFWFEIIAGVIIPFVMLAPRANRRRTGLMIVACALNVLGVFCKRVWLLFTGFQVPNVQGAEGVTVGNVNLVGDTAYAQFGSYMPTLPEIMIVVGVIAACVLAYMLLARRVCDAGAPAEG
ncbi:NrfD/PsrC family molybdoenzyme membrane anchor subunit [Curtanaerobium respiraculi]|uniref:NrfD/PsrC family molybdoenzyme membrane anchor subunit n=1 Tax=Curtanaerobium respiraculi TaxID=2949669 RepID=UPI0024B39774|nr:NrfD/PsrC family molybdoenzyme membrane anchor subunit [Curtanaerobium respiraculi]